MQNPGRKNAPREREWLFDIVRRELPKTVRRRAASSAVLILRSAHAQALPQSRVSVRASRRMRTAGPPSLRSPPAGFGPGNACAPGSPRGSSGRGRGAFWRNEAKTTLAIGVVPAKAGTHDHCRWLWVPALAALGRDDDRFGPSEAPTCGCAK